MVTHGESCGLWITHVKHPHDTTSFSVAIHASAGHDREGRSRSSPSSTTGHARHHTGGSTSRSQPGRSSSRRRQCGHVNPPGAAAHRSSPHRASSSNSRHARGHDSTCRGAALTIHEAGNRSDATASRSGMFRNARRVCTSEPDRARRLENSSRHKSASISRAPAWITMTRPAASSFHGAGDPITFSPP